MAEIVNGGEILFHGSVGILSDSTENSFPEVGPVAKARLSHSRIMF